jgi:hypothetical protein
MPHRVSNVAELSDILVLTPSSSVFVHKMTIDIGKHDN